MAANVWNYLTGYVIIIIEGFGLERLLNRIAADGIDIWDISRSGGSMRLSIGIGGFYRLSGIVRGSGCRVRIEQKHGLTVFLCHNRSRYALAAGSLAALSALLVLSRFVWVIDIEGCRDIDEAFIMRTLEDIGVSTGVRRGSIDTALIGREVMRSDRRIAWAGAGLTGVVLQIAVVEAEEDITVHTPGAECSIYASHSGIITGIQALSGRPELNVGDAVKAGELLIDGSLGNGIFVEARGSVEAEVLHRISTSVGWVQMLPRPSGRSAEAVWIGWRGRDILPAKARFEQYRMGSVERRELGSILPLQICSASIEELTRISTRADRAELERIAMERAQERLSAQLPQGAAIVSSSSRCTVDETGLTLTLDVIARQNIAVVGEIKEDGSGTGQHTGNITG